MARGSASKKTALASEQERPDIARKRAGWKARQGSIDLKRLVFIDETWAKINMAPLRGWAARGQRLIGRAPFGHWKHHDLHRRPAPRRDCGPLGDRRADQRQSILLLCRAGSRPRLAPALRPDDIVILDNLGSLKAPAIRQAIRAAGARLLFAPACSPDPCVAEISPLD